MPAEILGGYPLVELWRIDGCFQRVLLIRDQDVADNQLPIQIPSLHFGFRVLKVV